MRRVSMVISFTSDKIVLELPREEFESLAPEAIESGVLSELRKMLAVKRYSRGEITSRELMDVVGPETALAIIQAKQVTEESIGRLISEYQAGV
jgi:hypothetical protein